MKRCIVVSMLCVLSWTAQATELPFLAAKVKTLVTFKDGTVFVMKEGKVKVGADGMVVTAPISNAAFGTVGVTSQTPGVTVNMLTASAAPDSQQAARSFVEARRSATGRPVEVLRRGNDNLIQGELLGLHNPSGIATQLGMPKVTGQDELILTIKQADGMISLLPMSEVESWRFLDSEALDRDPDQTGQHLRIALEGTQPGQEVSVAYYYLWKGVRWTPSYVLERTKQGRVQLELQGEIANQLLDLKGSDLHLVVGVPNFMFLDEASPMVAQKTLQQVTTVLQETPIFSNDFARNARFTQVTMNGLAANAAPIEVRQPEPGAAPALPDVQSSDAGSLHLFRVQDVDLAKGERAIVKLAQMDLGCRDLVTWEIADQRVRRANHQPGPQDRAANPLIHYWLLSAQDTPLTTGPALVMKDGVALSQDQIYYTPRNSEGRFKVGTAVGVVGVAEETVLLREPGSMEVKDKQSHYHGKAFWLMKEIRWVDETRELSIQVRNGMAFDTELQVSRQFHGRPEDPPEAVSLQTLGGMGETQDQLNRLAWTVNLKPGEGQELKIRYKVRVFTKR